ncbi:hypothetical protein JQ032_09905 [Clostridium botulinum]|nr:hypothetical protein [Clostridium botulinum]MCS4474192.1 hypothetical protein [Clostridium botulinum]MCS4475856.1 hypothetical protein [Clostridium botulinum]
MDSIVEDTKENIKEEISVSEDKEDITEEDINLFEDDEEKPSIDTEKAIEEIFKDEF